MRRFFIFSKFILLLVLLSIFCFLTNRQPDFFQMRTGLWNDLSWIILLVLLVSWFCITSWQLIQNSIADLTTNEEQDRPFVWPWQRDVYLARYGHLNSEITRYRDLSSQKSAFIAWAVYGGLILAKNNLKDYLNFSNESFLIFIFFTAIACTILHLFCELMVERNQNSRRLLEEDLSLRNPYHHDPNQESRNRIGFWPSILLIQFFIWSPVLTLIIFFRKS